MFELVVGFADVAVAEGKDDGSVRRRWSLRFARRIAR